MGRAGVEYAPTRGRERERQEKAKEEDKGPRASDEPRLEAVRDVVAKWDAPVTPGAIALKREWPLATVEARLRALSAKGIIRDEGIEGAPVYVYVRPDGAGAAHEVQRKGRRAPREERRGQNGRGAAVAGTGRGPRVSNADVRDLIEAAKAQGCKAELAPNGHWRITTPDDRRVLISNTPRSARTVENDRSRLRRFGVNV
jgi:hypothetical protein